MGRTMVKERENRIPKDYMFLGICAGFGFGYLIALVQHQAELTKVLSSM